MKIKAKTAGISFVILMIMGISLSMASGYWATEGSRVPIKYTDGEFAGENNPADIRGSYALADIERAFEIPVDTLAAAFGLSDEENPEAIQVKLFEELFGIIDGREIGTDSMRYFVALYKGLPFAPEENTALPKPAVSILRKEAALSPEQLSQLEMIALSLESAHSPSENTSEEHDELELKEIKGKTLFAELYEWGVTKEELETIIGMPVGPRGISVREYVMEQGVEFSTVKEPIQDLLGTK